MNCNILYVIGHRGTNQYRLKNLVGVLRWLNSIDITPLVIEQDNEQKLINLNCKYDYMFVRNNGLYNRSWAFNIAYKHKDFDYMVCADNDMVMDTENIQYIFNSITNYDAIKPFKRLYDMSDADSDMYLSSNKLNITTKPRGGMNFSSGICILSKTFFDDINGWDERFRGWGGEDDAITYCLNAMKCKTIEHDFNCYHLFHERSKNDGTHMHDNYTNNLYILNEYHNNFSGVLEYKKSQIVGDVNKYAND